MKNVRVKLVGPIIHCSPDLTRTIWRMSKFVERSSFMKKGKWLLLDTFALSLIVLNYIAIACTLITKDTFYRITNILDYVVAGLILYAVFLIPIAIILGIILKIISIIKKLKTSKRYWINIVYIIIFVLTIPIWYKIWFVALMGV